MFVNLSSRLLLSNLNCRISADPQRSITVTKFPNSSVCSTFEKVLFVLKFQTNFIKWYHFVSMTFFTGFIKQTDGEKINIWILPDRRRSYWLRRYISTDVTSARFRSTSALGAILENLPFDFLSDSKFRRNCRINSAEKKQTLSEAMSWALPAADSHNIHIRFISFILIYFDWKIKNISFPMSNSIGMICTFTWWTRNDLIQELHPGFQNNLNI